MKENPEQLKIEEELRQKKEKKKKEATIDKIDSYVMTIEHIFKLNEIHYQAIRTKSDTYGKYIQILCRVPEEQEHVKQLLMN